MQSKSLQIRSSAFAISFLLSGCYTTEVVPIAEPQTRLVSPHDPAANITLKCDALFAKSGEAHRLCVMRGMDRLQAERSLPTYGCYSSPCIPSGVPLIGGAAASPAPPTIFIR